MQTPLREDAVTFGPFRLEARRRVLLNGGQPVRLGSRALDILSLLVRRSGEAVSKEEIFAVVWSGARVDEVNLRVHVAALRKALGERGGENRYIVSIPGVGYRFVAAALPATTDSNVASTASPARNALPVPLTAVHGRAETIDGIANELRKRRLVTIAGAGGIGKTTVAISVAHTLAAHYSDGVALVDLATIQDPRLVALAFGTSLGLTGIGERLVDEIITFLRRRNMLLVLDNCEHVRSEASALASAIVDAVPRIDLLATSREPLGSRREWVWWLPPLALPTTSETLSASEAARSPAVQLFVERATASVESFAISDTNAGAIADLCRQLDGMPLAIELAAARVDTFGLTEISAQLGGRWGLTMRGRRTALPRHQTLRATLDWSYESLSVREQTILRRLAVFQAMFTADAAISVAADEVLSERDVRDTIAALVMKSLVVADLDDDEPRYRLFVLTRSYASEKLLESGESATTRQNHASWVHRALRALERAASDTTTLVLASAGDLLADDLRAALTWALNDDGDGAMGCTILAAIPFWATRSRLPDIIDFIQRALGHQAFPSLATAVQVRLNVALAVFAFHLHGEIDSPSLETYIDAGTEEERSWFSEIHWFAAFQRGDYPLALQLAERRLEIASTGPDAPRRDAARAAGMTLHYSGDHRRARPLLEYVAGSGSVSTYYWSAVEPATSARIWLARISWLEGYPERARCLAEEALKMALESGHAIAICCAISQAVLPIAIWCGDAASAEALARELLRRADAQSLAYWRSWSTCFAWALRLEPMVEAAPLTPDPAQMDMLGTIREDLVTAGALARSKALDALWCAPEILRAAAESELARDPASAHENARALLLRSLAIARHQGATSWELRTTLSLARLWGTGGQRQEAMSALEEVLERVHEGRGTRDVVAAQSFLEQARRSA